MIVGKKAELLKNIKLECFFCNSSGCFFCSGSGSLTISSLDSKLRFYKKGVSYESELFSK